MEKLILEVGKTYLNSNNKQVTIIRAYDEESAEYTMGYRFRGDDGFSYTESGQNEVVFNNGIHHHQQDSYPLVSEAGATESISEDVLEEEIGVGQTAQTNFYRNGLGKIVLIIAELAPAHKLYNKGYRFVDHRGTYYTQEGSTQWSIYKSLDLVEKVYLDDISEEEKQRLRREGDSWLLWAAKKFANFTDLYYHTSGVFLIAHGAVLTPFTVAGAILDTTVGFGVLLLNKHWVAPWRTAIHACYDSDVDLHLQA